MAVRITGMGAVTPFGVGMEPLVSGLLAGVSTRVTPAPLPLPFRDKIGVCAFAPSLFDRRRAPLLELIVKAVDEALLEAGLSRASLAGAALMVGTAGYVIEAEASYRAEKEAGEGDPVPLAIQGPGRVTSRLAEAMGIGGPRLTVTTACTSGANALLSAWRLLEAGEAERAVVVGVEFINSLTLSGFFSLMLLGQGGCRPFDRGREGIHMGEGVAALILERGKGGLTLCGGSNLCDTHNVVSINPDGSSVLRVMEAALAASGVKGGEIVAVKAHGIGGREGDAAEAAALRRLFGDALPPVVSFKGALGHTLGASGILETAALLRSMERGKLPPTAGFTEADPELGFAPTATPVDVGGGGCLLNFLGFGGNNTTIVCRHE